MAICPISVTNPPTIQMMRPMSVVTPAPGGLISPTIVAGRTRSASATETSRAPSCAKIPRVSSQALESDS